MEQRMKCPHCGRCIGFVQSTDDEKVIVYDTHEPIISQELWDKVKEIEMSVSQGKSQGNQIAHFLD